MRTKHWGQPAGLLSAKLLITGCTLPSRPGDQEAHISPLVHADTGVSTEGVCSRSMRRHSRSPRACVT